MIHYWATTESGHAFRAVDAFTSFADGSTEHLAPVLLSLDSVHQPFVIESHMTPDGTTTFLPPVVIAPGATALEVVQNNGDRFFEVTPRTDGAWDLNWLLSVSHDYSTLSDATFLVTLQDGSTLEFSSDEVLQPEVVDAGE